MEERKSASLEQVHENLSELECKLLDALQRFTIEREPETLFVRLSHKMRAVLMRKQGERTDRPRPADKD